MESQLKFNLGNISILSSGEFQGTLAEGSFKDAKVESAFELKELPPLLKLEKSLASNGKAQLSGTISGKLTTPEVKGTLLAPGKFSDLGKSVRMTGAKKPFRIDAGDIKAQMGLLFSKWEIEPLLISRAWLPTDSLRAMRPLV